MDDGQDPTQYGHSSSLVGQNDTPALTAPLRPSDIRHRPNGREQWRSTVRTYQPPSSRGSTVIANDKPDPDDSNSGNREECLVTNGLRQQVQPAIT